MTRATISVRVHAGARHQQLLGFRDGVLEVRVAAAEPDGRANTVVCRLLGRRLGVAPSRILIVSGRYSQDKLVVVEGLDQARVNARLRSRTRATRRHRIQVRRALAVCLALAVAVFAFMLGGTDSPTSELANVPLATRTLSTRTFPAPTVSASRRRRRPHRSLLPDPAAGSLPQTSELPSADTRTFNAEMRALWEAIRIDSVSPGLPTFFPKAAYGQLKALAQATSDYQARLLVDYRLDIHAAHALLGAHAGRARLIRAIVPSNYAHWIDPGVCLNQLGYYEVPNTRLVYSENGQVSSLGIASMISWRGVWYVVHLGAVLRDTATGVVDDPSPGVGVSAPSSTC